MDHDAPVKATYDDTPPRNDLILALTFGSLFVLIGLHFVFTSYFVEHSEAQVREKILTRGTDQVAARRAEDARKLHQGKVPIEQAMAALAQEGRAGIPIISPRPSEEVDALKGWSFHPEFEARKAAVDAEVAGAAAVAAEDEGADAPAVERAQEEPAEPQDVEESEPGNQEGTL